MKLWSILTLLVALPAFAQTGLDQAVQSYSEGGKLSFDATRGEKAWKAEQTDAQGKTKSCTTCHGQDLTKPGKHAKTGKRIEPMARSVNAERLTDSKEIEKWFKRNCKWVYDRECSNQEKGDFLKFLETQ